MSSNNDIIDKKREFLKKIKEKNLGDTSPKIIEFLNEMEKELEKGGLLTEDVRKMIVSMRARIGLPEYIGAQGDASKAKDFLKIDIIEILKTSGKIIKIEELKRQLAKKGWQFGAFSLENFLFKMVKKGEILVKRGYVWIGSLRDTIIGKKFIEYIKEHEVVKSDQLCNQLGLDHKICEILINELAEAGLITYDGEKVYLIS